ncbi:E3 SUMO-protein ligase ZBED1-like [Paramisgurnus dabryanus]|uniref:E3 SUMO-protein ligase ZBED1-like n=1 Tax=Paramisgurnus dabryanus TaxID=90735 RepID=UPI0031F3D9E6
MEDNGNKSVENERRVITPNNLRSSIWKHFGFWTENKNMKKDKVVCKLCDREFPYHSSTTSMRGHMQLHHPDEYKDLEREEPPAKQPKLTNFFPPSAPLNAARKEAINSKLAKFICRDMRPISIVEGEGFIDFVRELEPRYIIPSRTTVTKNIAKIYDTTRENMRQILSGKNVALTTDGWSSLATEAYITVTAHVISETWEFHDFVLQTKQLRGSHTAENVAECITGILRDFAIQPDSVVAFTTDNALNYVNAVEQHLGAVNIPCLAHTINLAVRKGLDVRAIDTTLARLRKTASHFHRSTTDSSLLEDKQRLLGLKPDKLINDCVTRWNSTYDMICRASEQQAAVAAVIFDKKMSNLELTTSEWRLVEQVQETLKPFKVATQALSTSKYPTSSAVLPLQHILLSQVQKISSESDERSCLREMASKIEADLSKCYDPKKEAAFMLLNKASYLDPRFHRLIHITEEKRQQVRANIREELSLQSDNDEPVEAEPCSSGSSTGKTALTAMGDLFGDVYSRGYERPNDVESDLLQEMMRYEKEPPLPADSDPLLWWKIGSTKYPHLAQLAMKYLSVPGTSVRSERVFSTAGHIVNKKRSALDPENVDRLVFLSNNL